MKKKNLNDKTIIVTGASSGIGYEICKYLLDNYTVKIIGISKTESKIKGVFTNFLDRFIPLALDVSNKSAWEYLNNYVINNGIEVYAIINSAGYLPKFLPFSNGGEEEVFNALSVNFNSIVFSANYILPHIRKNKGLMINITSSSALCPFSNVSAYSVSKVASERFSTCLSFEEKDATVVTVMPGFTKTDIMRNQTASEKELKLIDKISSSSKKVAKKIIKKSLKGKKRIIIGFDAHMMNFLYKFFPRLAPKIINYVLKKSKIEMFKEI